MTRGNFIIIKGKPTFMECYAGEWMRDGETFVRSRLLTKKQNKTK